MFVREPLERLLSAYRDKRAYVSHKDLKSYTFKHFLEKILATELTKLNQHVYPYVERCHPCSMEFDYIGLHNNFENDMTFVLTEINALNKVAIPKQDETGYNFPTSEKLVTQYYKNVPNEMIHQMWKKYYKDFYIFGFPYPSHIMH